MCKCPPFPGGHFWVYLISSSAEWSSKRCERTKKANKKTEAVQTFPIHQQKQRTPPITSCSSIWPTFVLNYCRRDKPPNHFVQELNLFSFPRWPYKPLTVILFNGTSVIKLNAVNWTILADPIIQTILNNFTNNENLTLNTPHPPACGNQKNNRGKRRKKMK